jgi:DNA-binding NarL/FixJ family response regulator
VNLLIVDDHPVVAEYLRNAAGRAVPDAVVRIAGDLDAAFESMRENPAELVLLDLGLPECGGVESVLRFRKEYPDARVVVISSEDERNAIRGCIALGAAGFIPKTAGPKEMVNALRIVAGGGRYIPALEEKPRVPVHSVGEVPGRGGKRQVNGF